MNCANHPPRGLMVSFRGTLDQRRPSVILGKLGHHPRIRTMLHCSAVPLLCKSSDIRVPKAKYQPHATLSEWTQPYGYRIVLVYLSLRFRLEVPAIEPEASPQYRKAFGAVSIPDELICSFEVETSQGEAFFVARLLHLLPLTMLSLP